jgi:N-acetylmuramate 1-kinase
MDAPPGKGDDPKAFLAVARHLVSLGLSAPRLIAADSDQGFLLLEDFGDAIFARIAAAQPEMEPVLYAAAVDAGHAICTALGRSARTDERAMGRGIGPDL